jgi:hypothetical protein
VIAQRADPAYAGRVGHAGGEAQAGGGNPRAANLVDEQVEHHVPRRLSEQRGIEVGLAMLAHAVDGPRQGRQLVVADTERRARVHGFAGLRLELLDPAGQLTEQFLQIAVGGRSYDVAHSAHGSPPSCRGRVANNRPRTVRRRLKSLFA